MAEDLIKLLASRAERYPQPDDSDKVRTAIEKLAEQVPVLGPATVHILSQFLLPAYQRRQEEWFKELAEGVDLLAAKVEGFKIGDLQHNETFVSAVFEASRVAISTHNQEKREGLRNAVLNISLGQAPEEDLQQMFLRYIDELTGTHVQLLRFLSDAPGLLRSTALETQGFSTYRQVLQMKSPRLGGQHDLIRQVLIDLHSRGLSTVKDADDSLTNMPALTGHGQAFLDFVSLPQMLRRDSE